MHIGALFRLFWRPAAMSALFAISMASMAPFVMFGEQVSAVQSAVHLGLTLPLIVGVFASSAADELLRQPGSWMLPGLRRSLAAGDVLMVLVLSAIVGVMAWRAGGAALAAGVAIIAPFWYAVGGGARLAATRPKLIGASALAVLAMAAVPAMYARAVTGALPLAAAVAAGATVVLMRARWSRSVARMRTAAGAPESRLSGSTVVFSRTHLLNARGHLDTGLTPTLRFWLRAAAYEYTAGRRVAWTVRGVMTAVIAHTLQLVLPVVMLSMSQRGMQLGNALLYPISRRRRATILFACNVVDMLLLSCAFTLPFVILRAVQVPVLPFTTPRPAHEWILMLASSIAFAPVIQWARARGPIPPSRVFHGIGYGVAFAVATTLLALETQKVLVPRTGLLGALALIAGLGIAIQLAQYAALQRLYRRTDLVE